MKNPNIKFAIITGIVPLLFIIALVAQSPPQPKPCSTPEAAQFDFWVGTWELTWNDTLTGTNVITKDLDGCVIHENFESHSSNFKGKSYSVYNPTRGLWQQTWVDNNGGYLDFTGGLENDKMVLSRSFVGPKGNYVMQRMIFSNITYDSLNWSWETSVDSGSTWDQKWHINYKRIKD